MVQQLNRHKKFLVPTKILLSLTLFSWLASCGLVDERTDRSDLRQDDLPVVYYLAEDVPSEAQEAVHAAFEAWETALNANIFEFGGLRNSEPDKWVNASHPLKNVIFVSEDSGKIDPPLGDGIDAIARTVVRGSTKIRDSDIILFGYTQNYVVGRGEAGDVYSVRTVMMHEIGRMLFGDRGGTDELSVLNNPVYPKGHALEKVKVSKGDVDLFYRTYADLL